MRTLVNSESTGSTNLLSTARGDGRFFPITLSVSPIFTEDLTLCKHLLAVRTSLGGVVQLNSGDAIPPENFFRSMRAAIQKVLDLHSAWPMQGDGNVPRLERT